MIKVKQRISAQKLLSFLQEGSLSGGWFKGGNCLYIYIYINHGPVVFENASFWFSSLFISPSEAVRSNRHLYSSLSPSVHTCYTLQVGYSVPTNVWFLILHLQNEQVLLPMILEHFTEYGHYLFWGLDFCNKLVQLFYLSIVSMPTRWSFWPIQSRILSFPVCESGAGNLHFESGILKRHWNRQHTPKIPALNPCQGGESYSNPAKRTLHLGTASYQSRH